MDWTRFSLSFYKNEEKVYQNNFQNLSKKDKYLHFNMLNYETKFNIEEQLFTRENKEFYFKLDIKNNQCSVLLKKEDIIVDIQVEYCKLNVSKNQIILEYMIESEDAKIIIIIKRIGDVK